MSEKNTNVTETVEIDPGMSVMPEGPGLMDVPTVIPELDTTLAAMSSALPAYQTTAWKNKPSTETPVDAAVMTRVEQRLVDLTNAVNALRDSVSHKLNSTIPGTLSLPTEGDIGKGFVAALAFDGPGGNKYAFNISKGDSPKVTLYDMTGSKRLWEI